jgi:hypothetical protein
VAYAAASRVPSMRRGDRRSNPPHRDEPPRPPGGDCPERAVVAPCPRRSAAYPAVTSSVVSYGNRFAEQGWKHGSHRQDLEKAAEMLLVQQAVAVDGDEFRSEDFAICREHVKECLHTRKRVRPEPSVDGEE